MAPAVFTLQGAIDHARRAERAGGDGGADVAVIVAMIGQRLHLGHTVLGLLHEGALARGRHDEMRLDVGDGPEHLQQADAIDGRRWPR